MDRMPSDPSGADALYEQSPEVFPPDASNAVAPQHLAPSQPDTGATPPGDDAPPPDWRERLERAETAAEAATRRAREFDALIARASQQQEQQQELTLEQQFEAYQNQLDDLTPQQIRETNAAFRAAFKRQRDEAKQQATQVQHRDTVSAFKREFVQPTMPDLNLPRLTPEEAAELDEWDQDAIANPNVYIKVASSIVARRKQLGTLEERLAALERDTEAEQHIAAGIHRVGGSGGGSPIPQAPNDTDYDYAPWTRR